MSSGLRVLIIGGGLGGLCLAQGLRRSGVDVGVFERDRSVGARAQGYRVHLDARGTQPLRECLPVELFDLFEASCGQPSTGMAGYRVEDVSLVLRHADRFPTAGDGEVLARPGRAVDRLTLREILLDGLDDIVHFGTAFTGYDLLPSGGVRARFADGSTMTGDLLVGADGVNSRVRQQLLPEVTLTDTGIRWLGGRTVLDEQIAAQLPVELADRAVWVLDRRGGYFLAAVRFSTPPNQAAQRLRPHIRFTHDRDYLMWAMVGPTGRLPAPDDDLAAMPAAHLHELAQQVTADAHPMLATVVHAADPTSSFYLAIRATPPISSLPPGPVTLLGDAAHAGPVNGNGANSALRDAGLLRHHLNAAGYHRSQLPAALDEYQAEMLRNAHAVQRATNAQLRGRMASIFNE